MCAAYELRHLPGVSSRCSHSEYMAFLMPSLPVSFNPAGTLLACGAANGQLHILDAKNLAAVRSFKFVDNAGMLTERILYLHPCLVLIRRGCCSRFREMVDRTRVHHGSPRAGQRILWFPVHQPAGLRCKAVSACGRWICEYVVEDVKLVVHRGRWSVNTTSLH